MGPEIIDLSMPPLWAFFFFAGLELLEAAAALLDLEEDLATRYEVGKKYQIPRRQSFSATALASTYHTWTSH